MNTSRTQPPLRPKEDIHLMKGFRHSLSDKEREAIRKSLEQQESKFKDIERTRATQKSRGLSR